MIISQEIEWLLKEKYRGQKTEEFFADCARLEAGEPLAYLIGSIPFLDCAIHLDSRPLIPRPETEYWVEKAINSIRESRQENIRVLDLCAGSGAIGVAVAKAIPEALVTFAEIDADHLPTIQKNLRENTFMSESVKYPVLASDLFSHITGPFDYILSNPPYIDPEAGTVDETVTAYEPHRALFGGIHGMEVITRIVKDTTHYLTPTGQLWIEHEPFQAEALRTIGDTYGYHVEQYEDHYGTVRYSVLTRTMAE